jgi:Holliday junction resolvase
MTIDPAFYRIYEACELAGWSGAPADMATALKKLNRGLPMQDEFCLLMSWLGRSRLIHGLGQQQYPPTSAMDYRVPDLLIIFESGAGPIPVLIEVKSSAKPKLSWRPDFYDALARYGKLLGLPVLLAWKHTPGAMWALVDISVFTKTRQNYHLTFAEAMGNSVMSLLAGDFLIQFTPGFGLHLHFRKLFPRDDNGVHCVVEEAYFVGPSGDRFTSLRGGLWPFFLTLDADSKLEETETHLHQSFVLRQGWSAQFAHRGFPALLSKKQGKSWRKLLDEHSFKVLPNDVREAAREAFQYSATSGLMRIIPQHVPPYLERLKGVIDADW